MNLKTNNIYTIKLTTITPVSIGDGGVLSPLSDYIYDNGEICLINHKKFEEKIEEIYNAGNEEIITEYVNVIKQDTDKDKTKTLRSFIVDNLGVENWKEELCFSNTMKSNNRSNPRDIKTCLRNNQEPYISGSTLKGAIKGALLCEWLESDIEGKEEMKVFADSLDIVYHKKSIERKYTQLELNLYENIENTDTYMDFSLFKVTDTIPFSKFVLSVYNTHRVSIKKDKKSGIPITFQTINKNQSSRFDICIDKLTDIKNEHLTFLQKDDAIKILFQKINFFSYRLMYEDAGFIREHNSSRFREHIFFLESHLEELETLSKKPSSTCYIRIGSGKGYLNNSIGIPLLINHFDEFEKIVRAYYKDADPQKFPSTFTVTNDESQLPLGWVKLELID
ncbi:type III-A CRISPR-associated RAMP protein Csm5 [Bernardetia sp. MNP-M8]|uniref:type III-A CRISPR-associated RAMP protein Csm5 n=1 Tax=Bernardetia sp. MNP-M8 TaxID=3127470 RepID=UPI0030D5A2D5